MPPEEYLGLDKMLRSCSPSAAFSTPYAAKHAHRPFLSSFVFRTFRSASDLLPRLNRLKNWPPAEPSSWHSGLLRLMCGNGKGNKYLLCHPHYSCHLSCTWCHAHAQCRDGGWGLTGVAGVAAALECLLQAQEVLLTLAARVAEVLPPVPPIHCQRSACLRRVQGVCISSKHLATL